MEFDIYFANLSIETLSSVVLRTDDDSLLKDIIHFSSLSDDQRLMILLILRFKRGLV